MTDDIVIRLRNESAINQALKIFDDEGDVAADAADEIERLREDFETSQTALRKWIQIIEKIEELLNHGC